MKFSILAFAAALAVATYAQDTTDVEIDDPVLVDTPVEDGGDDNGILVVGGKEAPKGQYTWTVNLRRSQGGSSFCGGSLIAPQYVLTAAHCVAGGKPAYVAVGTHFNSGTSDGEQIQVLSATSHPGYSGDTLKGNDVAILKLARASKFAPIGLGKNPINGGATAKLLGWGQTSGPQGNPSTVLKENDFTVVTNADCQAKLRTSNNFRGWTAQPTHICAGGVTGQAACFGDSGGPLVIGNTLIGDVSFGEPCAKGLPDVYGRVSAFKAFIDQYAKGHTWV
ncbi:Aste57867_13489 [Aphanomyces stellatus]|uniref:Aste57867_13489 protein n=1 Tax=Aphanomyces stellatus TaxID=120398 RepID=A0A485L0B5_9STRA|nr:hypothetical protein As57867_013439 [Aphanomyces stellatus]VFT90327.1 Aste57867_13489 [Aphanomyces stellatus]